MRQHHKLSLSLHLIHEILHAHRIRIAALAAHEGVVRRIRREQANQMDALGRPVGNIPLPARQHQEILPAKLRMRGHHVVIG